MTPNSRFPSFSWLVNYLKCFLSSFVLLLSLAAFDLTPVDTCTHTQSHFYTHRHPNPLPLSETGRQPLWSVLNLNAVLTCLPLACQPVSFHAESLAVRLKAATLSSPPPPHTHTLTVRRGVACSKHSNLLLLQKPTLKSHHYLAIFIAVEKSGGLFKAKDGLLSMLP